MALSDKGHFIRVCRIGDTENLRIETGIMPDGVAVPIQSTVIVSEDNPNTLWNLLYDRLGIPCPILPRLQEYEVVTASKVPQKPQEPQEPKVPQKPQEPQETQDPQVVQKKVKKEVKDLSSFQGARSGKKDYEGMFAGMSARQIIEKVLVDRGVLMDVDPKNKKMVIRQAEALYAS